ncbi:transporter (plasmid) [Pseudomonas sp. App30]|uniref:SphA family protein n=1 Tax=Pseudomonas sp. App30 TaxID=3068990 RepID=UPI003A7F74C8
MNTRAYVCLLLSVVSYTNFSCATENGDTTWPLGVQTVVPALMPPPGGTEFYSYTVYYHADSYKGNSGRSAIPGFKLDNFVQALRLVHTWNYQTDSGVQFTSGLIGTGGHIKVEAGGQSDEKTGMRQAYITPLNVLYSPTPQLHLLGGVSVFTPIGGYDKRDLANTTPNYTTYISEFALTWFPHPNWEVSLAPTFSVNQRNKDTDYRSGNVFNVDYMVGYRFDSMPKLQFGVAGYYTKQVTDDDIDGTDLPNGNRLEKFAVGPQLFYSFTQSAGVVLKWLHETNVKNGPMGDSVWLEAAFPL